VSDADTDTALTAHYHLTIYAKRHFVEQEEELAQWRTTQTERVHLELRQMRQQGMAAERQLREEAERGINRMVQSAEQKLKEAVDVNMMHAQEVASSQINRSLGNVMGEWNKKMFKEATLMPVSAAVNWEVCVLLLPKGV
jgi:hypothetical protein